MANSIKGYQVEDEQNPKAVDQAQKGEAEGKVPPSEVEILKCVPPVRVGRWCGFQKLGFHRQMRFWLVEQTHGTCHSLTKGEKTVKHCMCGWNYQERACRPESGRNRIRRHTACQCSLSDNINRQEIHNEREIRRVG